MQFIMPEAFSIFTGVIIIIGIVVAVQGFASLFTGKLYGKEYQKYTEESIAKAARPVGACMGIAGLLLVLAQFVVYNGLDYNTSHLISSGVALGVVAIAIVLMCVMLKKKDEPKKDNK